MEGSPFSDYALFEAAYNQGWIDSESKFWVYYNKSPKHDIRSFKPFS